MKRGARLGSRPPWLLPALARLEARRAVGASTARGQGAQGVVWCLRESLADVDLSRFRGLDDERFVERLDLETVRLRRHLPAAARSWGLSRKCLNIFLRNCVYNAHLRDAFQLAPLEPFLEVPLDGKVVEQLGELFPKAMLPPWRGVRYLDPGESEVFQLAAGELARAWSIDRIHLDAVFWPK